MNVYGEDVIKKASELFAEIKQMIENKESVENYREISPRIDAVILTDTESGEATLVDFIKTEFDIPEPSSS